MNRSSRGGRVIPSAGYSSRPLFGPRKKSKVPYLFAGLLILFLFLGIFPSNFGVALRRRSIHLDALPSALEHTSVLHIAGLAGQKGGDIQKTIDSIPSDQKPDLVLLSGPLTSGNTDEKLYYYNIIESCSAQNIPVFFTVSSQDYEPVVYYADQTYSFTEYIQGAIDRGGRFLDRAYVVPVKQGELVLLPGTLLTVNIDAYLMSCEATLQSDAAGSEKAKALYGRERMQTLQDVLQSAPADVPVLALSAKPYTAGQLEEYQSLYQNTNCLFEATNLILSSAFSGYAWQLPLAGPVRINHAWLSNGWFPGAKNVYGVIRAGGLAEVVSGNYAASQVFPLRFFSRREISLLTLTAENVAD